jgi:hypothetical protein
VVNNPQSFLNMKQTNKKYLLFQRLSNPKVFLLIYRIVSLIVKKLQSYIILNEEKKQLLGIKTISVYNGQDITFENINKVIEKEENHNKTSQHPDEK